MTGSAAARALPAVDVEPRWQLRDGDIAWQGWGDECVVRIARSAFTCLLSAAAGELVRLLIEAERPLSLAELAAALVGAESPTDDDTAAVQSLLHQLEGLEIAERA